MTRPYSEVELEAISRSRRHSCGWTAILVSIVLMLVSCGPLVMAPIATEICRGSSSWQTERPVQGCEGGAPTWAVATMWLAIASLVVGVLLATSRPHHGPPPPDD